MSMDARSSRKLSRVVASSDVISLRTLHTGFDSEVRAAIQRYANKVVQPLVAVEGARRSSTCCRSTNSSMMKGRQLKQTGVNS